MHRCWIIGFELDRAIEGRDRLVVATEAREAR